MHNKAAVPAMFLTLAVALVVSACAPKSDTVPDQDSLTQAKAAGTVPDLKVSELQIGKAIGADMKVTTATTQFMPKDTIYLSVGTTGMAQDATLMLMVTSLADTATVVHDNKTISPTAPAVTEFHFSKPEGFKTGKYKAEIFLNGALADLKEFEIIRGR